MALLMNNELAIIVAFYLSKFNKEALKNLNFRTDVEAFKTIGQKLGVKENYVKFRRDEFDPIHPWRKGWSRPMDNRMVRAIEALQDLEESALRSIVLDILNDEKYRQSEEITRITQLFSEVKNENAKPGKYILRGPTGRAAEEYFISYHTKTKLPVAGQLIDCRDLGCGYDFKIVSDKRETYIEVKGLAEMSGGILFTDKEWRTAKEKSSNYIVCMVKNVPQSPTINFITNPHNTLKANKTIYTTVQINWSVAEKQLENTDD
jgi:hypothetical protein